MKHNQLPEASWLHKWLDLPSARQVSWQFNTLRSDMALSAQELQQALTAATDELASDVQNLVAKVEAAVADKEEAVRVAVAEALAGFEPIADRLTALGRDTVTADDDVPEEPLPPSGPPVTEPTPTPEPGESGSSTPAGSGNS